MPVHISFVLEYGRAMNRPTTNLLIIRDNPRFRQPTTKPNQSPQQPKAFPR